MSTSVNSFCSSGKRFFSSSVWITCHISIISSGQPGKKEQGIEAPDDSERTRQPHGSPEGRRHQRGDPPREHDRQQRRSSLPWWPQARCLPVWGLSTQLTTTFASMVGPKHAVWALFTLLTTMFASTVPPWPQARCLGCSRRCVASMVATVTPPVCR
jgi:hypothetical protein